MIKKIFNKFKRWWDKMFGLETYNSHGTLELEINSVNSFNKESFVLSPKTSRTVTFGGNGFAGWLTATPSITQYAGGMLSSNELGAGVKLTISGDKATIENKSNATITIFNGVY